ncbi:MAG TPA: type I-E CRISPR-associated endonuclease Cas1e [Candidatus Stackebrandtia excrementipullorum]|nr:type I-E CRISPR-associated endonuclease Cas1e [Candidatus Stackebrandtia excrementipullorum]
MNAVGARPPTAVELPRVSDRVSFLYLERSIIDCDRNALTVRDEQGVRHVPGATLGVLMLGPGTSVTHAARRMLADNGATLVDVGEQGVRYYLHGKPLSSSTRLLEAQAAAVSKERRRLAVARAMYAIRFPGEDVSGLNMQALRGKEGTRVKRLYRQEADRVGLAWGRREYDTADFESGTPINQALAVATSCLYGVVHAVIVSLGMSPGLGFVHTGYYPAFVHDIADLYKAETAFPVAFDVIAGGTDNISADVRYRMRDRFRSGKLLQRCVEDVQRLILPDTDPSNADWTTVDRSSLWDDEAGVVPGGIDHSRFDEDF